MTAIRAAFGIAPELYKDFAQLRRKVLEKAKAEIDHLSHFTVEWREIRRGRTITEIEFTFHPKIAPARLTAVDENDHHNAARGAWRDGAVGRVVAPPALPAPAAAPYQTTQRGRHGVAVPDRQPDVLGAFRRDRPRSWRRLGARPHR